MLERRAQSSQAFGKSRQGAASAPTKHKAYHHEDNRKNQQNLREISRQTGDSAKSEKRGHERYHGKDNSPSEHSLSPYWGRLLSHPHASCRAADGAVGSS
jgi:hypothetical protein